MRFEDVKVQPPRRSKRSNSNQTRRGSHTQEASASSTDETDSGSVAGLRYFLEVYYSSFGYHRNIIIQDNVGNRSLCCTSLRHRGHRFRVILPCIAEAEEKL